MDIEWVRIVVSILSGLAVCIPLAVKLVQVVRQAIREKNWTTLMKLVMDLMEEAEKKYTAGADKKEWVMGMIAASENTLNFDVDYETVSIMIDALCDMSRVVNGPKAGT